MPAAGDEPTGAPATGPAEDPFADPDSPVGDKERAFAAGHVPGTFNIGLDGGFSTYLGWLIPWGTPLTLLGETREEVAEAQRELVRIGIDRLAGAATGGPAEWAGIR